MSDRIQDLMHRETEMSDRIADKTRRALHRCRWSGAAVDDGSGFSSIHWITKRPASGGVCALQLFAHPSVVSADRA